MKNHHPSKTPSWVADAIFYQIFPDRFAMSRRLKKPAHLEPWDSHPTSHGFKGGDLLGLTEKLDYLQDLGVNALYLNPIFASPANHRYHTSDYFQVDPLLGGNEAFKTLLKKAHQRRIRIVLDGVFNHTGRGFFPFTHVLENGLQSPYKDWFHFNSQWLRSGHPLNPYPKTDHPKGPSIDQYGYQAWWDLPALPKLRVENPEVTDFIFQVARHWIQQGVDGWRLDVPEEIHVSGFWEQFRKVVKSANPEAYLIGEIWHDASAWLKGTRFDGVMNYLLTKAILGYFLRHKSDFSELKKAGGYSDFHPLSPKDFLQQIQKVYHLYSHETSLSQLNLLSSHDTARLYTLLGDDRSLLKLAYFFIFMLPGAPCIYYGDEVGMKGGHDPHCRGAFPWDSRQWDQEIRDFFKQCIALRSRHPELSHGTVSFLDATDDLIVFKREWKKKVFVIALNLCTHPRDFSLPLSALPLPPSKKRPFPVRNLITRKIAHLTIQESLSLHVEPKSGAIFGF